MKTFDTASMKSLLKYGLGIAVLLFLLPCAGCDGPGSELGSTPPHDPGCMDGCFVDNTQRIYIDSFDEPGGIQASGVHAGEQPWDLLSLAVNPEEDTLVGAVGLLFFSPGDAANYEFIRTEGVQFQVTRSNTFNCEGTTLWFGFNYYLPDFLFPDNTPIDRRQRRFEFNGTTTYTYAEGHDRQVCR